MRAGFGCSISPSAKPTQGGPDTKPGDAGHDALLKIACNGSGGKARAYSTSQRGLSSQCRDCRRQQG
jgi:hypothetical protein